MAARRALKAVLVDLNGTLHIEDAAVPGAQEALKRLRGTSVMVRFVTNTTKESKQDLLERLKKLEFDISEDEIFTSLTAARNLVEQKQVRPMLLVDDRALPDFKGIQTSDPNAVVIGLAPEHFHYQILNQAFRAAALELLEELIKMSLSLEISDITTFTENIYLSGHPEYTWALQRFSKARVVQRRTLKAGTTSLRDACLLQPGEEPVPI
ncbi:haloacid dehalogenase-like hydrolase domain-containing protein 2 isoform X3 [Felis catus]|uniref:haloacid dehalogenase-like hydrolase domain-containing protein 2 isoform X3 n=1 Tax=Felis catus TaxID=9685 RepID=UPI000948610D|nr:haloacid dehalogenase-like hydrolase domain-containing protein 2 isoform X3 [Felis catus]